MAHQEKKQHIEVRLKHGVDMLKNIRVETATRYLDFASWTNYAQTGGLRVAIPQHALTPIDLDKEDWGKLVLDSALTLTVGAHSNNYSQNNCLVPIKGMDRPDEAAGMVRALYTHETGYASRLSRKSGLDTDEGQYRQDKTRLLNKLAGEIKGKGKHRLFREAYRLVSEGESEEARFTTSMLGADLKALFLLLGGNNRILAGFEGHKVLWQKVVMPKMYHESGVPIYHLASPFIELLDIVREERLLAVMPKVLPEPGNFNALEVPGDKPTVRESLEQVYHFQKYIMGEGGATVIPREGRDISKIHIVENYDWLLARSETPYGDFTTAIDLDRAKGYSSEMASRIIGGRIPTGEVLEHSKLAAFTADIYRQVLCATGMRVLKTRRARAQRLGDPETRSSKDNEGYAVLGKLTYIYEDGSQPRQYEGPPRPIKPHQVRGHLRDLGQGQMSRQQFDKVIEFQRRTGLRVPRPGLNETVVSPHYSPEGSEEGMRSWPTFLREEHQDRAFGEFTDGVRKVILLDHEGMQKLKEERYPTEAGT